MRNLVKRVVAHPAKVSAYVMSSIGNACRETRDFAIIASYEISQSWGLTQTSINISLACNTLT